MMDFKVIILIFVWIMSAFAAGAPQLICPTNPLSAEEGGSVNISVSMDPTELTNDLVIFMRADHEDVIVHAWNLDGYYNKLLQTAAYRNLTSVILDPIRGVLVLEIRNLSLKDSGSYRVNSTYRTNCTFNISVAAKVDGDDEGHSRMQTLKIVLPATVVLLIIIIIVISLWRSGWIKWPRIRGSVCDCGGSQGPDPDPEVEFNPVPGEEADLQVVLCST